MKTPKSLYQYFLVKIFAGFILLTVTTCERHAFMVAVSHHEFGWPFFGGNEYESFYTDQQRFFRMAINHTPFIPLQYFDDLGARGCNETDVSRINHLPGISGPILCPGSGDGWGSAGDCTSSLRARSDLTYYLVNVPSSDLAYEWPCGFSD